MRRGLRISGFAVALGWTLACSDSTAGPTAEPNTQTPGVSKPAPTVVRIAIVPDTMRMFLSSRLSFAAYKVLSDSSRVNVNAFWRSGNDQIVTVGASNGYAVAVGLGQTVLIATVDGMSAAAPVIVVGPVDFGQSDALVIDSFSMIEFQYPSAPGRWFYAPQMRAHAKEGRGASVLVLKFSIPGLDNGPPFGCGAAMTITPRDLFGEVYGDWLLSIDQTGRRATGEAATATISFLDDDGVAATRIVNGPVVQGSLPLTNTGGASGGACFHGYGSTG